MNSVSISMIIVPGFVALLLFLVFTYLYEQSRQDYFRAWQLGWAAYTLHYALDGWSAYRHPSAPMFLIASLLLVLMALCIFISSRLMRERFRLRWYDLAIAGGGAALALWNLREHFVNGVFQLNITNLHLRLEVGLGAVLLYCSFDFFRYSQRKNSLAFKLLATAVALWAVLMIVPDLSSPYLEVFGTPATCLVRFRRCCWASRWSWCCSRTSAMQYRKMPWRSPLSESIPRGCSRPRILFPACKASSTVWLLPFQRAER